MKPPNYRKAFELFDDMNTKLIEPSTITFTTLIDVCAKMNPVKFDKAFELFDDMNTI